MTRFSQIMFVSLLLLIIPGVTGCGNAQPVVAPALPREVNVITLVPETPITQLLTTGSFSYRSTGTLAFETGGTISSLTFTENQPVHKDQLLGSLASRDLSLQVKLAETQWEQAIMLLAKAEKGAKPEQITLAESQYREALLVYEDLVDQHSRLVSLYQAGAIARRQLLDLELQLANMEEKLIQAKAGLELVKSGATAEELALLRAGVRQAELQLELATSQLAKTNLIAPFAGIVLKKIAGEGELVGPGQPVLVLGSPENLVFSFGVTAAQLTHLELRQKLQIDLSGSLAQEGTISSIAYLPDPATRLYQVEVALSPAGLDRLRAGMTGQVSIALLAATPALLVPPQAVVGRSDRQVVFVLDNEQKVREQTVTIGRIINDRLEITSGLTGGEQVVATGAPFLRDQEQVRVRVIEENIKEGDGR